MMNYWPVLVLIAVCIAIVLYLRYMLLREVAYWRQQKHTEKKRILSDERL